MQKTIYPLQQKKAKALGNSLYDKDFLKDFSKKRDAAIEVKLLDALNTQVFMPFENEAEKSAIISGLSSFISDKDILKKADEICRHEFDLLGSGKISVSYSTGFKGVEGHIYKKEIDSIQYENIKGLILQKRGLLGVEPVTGNSQYEPIDWHTDFKSGYTWDKDKWFRYISYGSTPGADVKVPWELSRMQHASCLGTAYLLTGDEKYCIEFITQVIDWVENNNPESGVNWRCTMDVGIRAANLILGFSFFIASPFFTDSFKMYFLKAIYAHGMHILKNLELGTITSNHYLSDISGLAVIGIFLSNFNIGKKWKSFAVREIKKEMNKQVYADGVDFEASSCYHRLVLELFFYPVFYFIKEDKRSGSGYRKKCEGIFGEEFTRRLLSMFNFILHLSKNDGEIPQFGDNDNGRFMIFGIRSILDVRYLAAYAAIFFAEPRFKIKQWDFPEEAIWVFGKEGKRLWDNLDFNVPENIKSASFKCGGIYIIRDRCNYMALNCSLNGQNGNGGHCHNDKLSFELQIDGINILCDPGTYLYTPDPSSRNLFRSTGFHNTIAVDKQEQNRFYEDNLFSIYNDADVGVKKFKDNREHVVFEAWHSGYIRLESPVLHRRRIIYSKKDCLWIINDLIEGSKEHHVTLSFHFFPGLKIKFEADSPDILVSVDETFSGIPGKLLSKNNTNSCLKQGMVSENYFMKITPVSVPDGLVSAIAEGYYSPGYGEKIPSKILKYSGKLQLPASLIFCLFKKDYEGFDPEKILEILESKF